MKKPLHIIIDGVDGIGKTTVCEILKNYTGLPVIKMPRTKEYIKKENVEEMSRFFNDTISQFEKFPFIMDRGFTSSVAYSKALGRVSDLGYLEEWIDKMSPKIFILTGTRRFRADDVYDDEQLDKVDTAFRSLIKDLSDCKIINVDDRTPFWVANEILESLEDEHEEN